MNHSLPSGSDILAGFSFPAILVSLESRLLLQANPAAEQWGLTAGSPYLCGQNQHPDCPLARAAKTGSLIQRIVWYEDSRGDEVPFQVFTTLLSGHEGDLILEYRIDISKQINYEKQLADERVRSEEHALHKDQFLANISHEIRTPLNTIIGFADRLYGQDHSPKDRQYLDFIVKSSKGLLTLMNDLIDLSKLEAGQIRLEYEMADLHQIIVRMKEFYLPQAVEKGISFIVDTRELEDTHFLLDSARVRQILGNLLGNAIKFTPEKGRVFLKVRSMEEGSMTDLEGSRRLFFDVTDTGIGIPEQSLDMIFDPFQQHNGRPDRPFGGTGMGLAICRKLIQKMGGKLGVTSVPGEGSTFSVMIPGIYTGDEDQVERILRLHQRLALVVDDYAVNRSILADYLHRFSFRTMEAENGEEAVSIARTYNPDIIFMDLSMPAMSGFEAAETLRSSAAGRRIPVVAVSSTYNSDILQKIRDKGFRDFLNKPVNPAALEELLEKLFLKDDAGVPRAPDNEPSPSRSLPAHGVRRFVDDFLQRYEEITKQNRIDEIDTFGLDLAGFGNEFDFPEVAQLGEALHKAAEMYNIEMILSLLEQFRKISSFIGEEGNDGRDE